MPFSEFFGFPQVTGNADIEVAMVESHANLKIRSKKKPKQLLKMVSNLQVMRLTILHLNVTTTNNDIVLYSLSVEVVAGELELNHECNLMHWLSEDFESKLQGQTEQHSKSQKILSITESTCSSILFGKGLVGGGERNELSQLS
ncbi:transcription factor bHLH96 [Arachis duranensis]|uniref:Transcription factor bHLH96 n=1 Tax=Arachis duranensis TaxID=130453 RepID=A0A9C6TX45_ARADU|nr:transcription factor bHLH96 [Arachis duranensis]XP_052118257.1 transcription factor bHLH96 [Arachis duranensis]XP_052118265.1 transcription factor bHLH96 [Arachis duranensis]